MRSLLCLLCLSACATFPQVDDRVSAEAEAAAFPTLLPPDAIAARAGSIVITESATQSVAARVARLEARARLMRGAPVDDATRARLAALAAR